MFEHHYPRLTGTTFEKGAEFSAGRENWPGRKARFEVEGDASEEPLAEVRTNISRLRHEMKSAGRPEEEHFFFRREMDCAARIGSWWECSPVWLYGFLSDYGYSVGRPLKGLGLVILLGALFLGCAYDFHDRELGFVAALWKGLGLSFTSTFNFFGFQRLYYGEFLQGAGAQFTLTTGFQTIAGYVLIFFLGLGLRQRFRLR